MEYIGEKDGMACYSPVDAEDVKAIDGRKMIVCEVKGERSKRTLLQNRAIHKYAAMVCEALNAAGWTKKKYYEVKEVDIEWTPDSVLEDIWRGIQEAMFNHRSTSKLETDQVSKVYEVMARHLANTCTINQSFPSRHGE
jgi:hypothetical protein